MFVLIAICRLANGQNLIGMHNSEIRKYMKENRKDMNFTRVRNTSYSYLKYTDYAETKTTFFFLAPDSVCTGVREVIATGLRSAKISELNANYRRVDDTSWTDSRGGRKYLIRLKDEEWSCTVSYEVEN